MRARKKKHAAERIAACAELLIEAPETLKPDPCAVFPDKSKPLCLEIGCGKGNFARDMAAAHPEINLIAMERVRDVLCIALEKARDSADTRADNLRFLCGDANNLAEWFPPHSVDCIFLNFSDPWPKLKHAKRRLTHRLFLEKYRAVLKPGGVLRFKTDNAGLFAFSLSEFAALGLATSDLSDDLHHSPLSEGNIMTEYEKNFSQKGFPIHTVTVHF